MLRVLRVVGSFDPAFGGPSVSALNSCLAASRAGVRTVVACPASRGGASGGEAAIERLRREDVEVFVFPLSRIGGDTARRWAISRECVGWIRRKVSQFDVVHCHSAWNAVSLAATLAARAIGKPAFLSPHESLTTFDMGGARWWRGVSKKVLKRVYARSLRRVVFSSRLELRDSIDGLPPDRAACIPHAVYDDRFGTTGGAVKVRPGQKFTVGFLGRLDPKKNCESLIRSISGLPEHVSLIIAGRGSDAYERRLRQLATSEGVDSRTRFVGFVGDGNKAEFFRSIDVLAMPSQYECFGMSAAEALMFGRAVIVSPETGVADVVDQYQCGLITSPEPIALARAVGTLEKDREMAEHMGARGIRAAGHELSFGRHGNDLRLEYENVCGGN